jgi:hypothetical protein
MSAGSECPATTTLSYSLGAHNAHATQSRTALGGRVNQCVASHARPLSRSPPQRMCTPQRLPADSITPNPVLKIQTTERI